MVSDDWHQNADEMLLYRYKTEGSRHPNRPFVTLSPTHPFTKIKIKRLEWEIKLSKLRDMNSIVANKLRNKIMKSDVQYERLKKGLMND